MALWSELYCSEREGDDEAGDGTKENPVKTILQAMKMAGKEPFPNIFVDAKTEGNAWQYHLFESCHALILNCINEKKGGNWLD